MKIIPLLIILSLAGNLLLGVMLWRQGPSASRADATTVSRMKSPLPSTTTTANPAAISSSQRVPLWTGLKSNSIGDAISRLRAAGCPPREIAAAAAAMIDNLRREKLAALGYVNETLPYWKQFQRFATPHPPDELNALGMETERLRRIHLLSPELYAANEEFVARDRHRFGNLDPEKLRRLAIIESETAERTVSAWQSGSANPGESRYPESKPNAHEEIERQRNAAIMATLTADEYAQYDLRNSRTANILRSRLETFRPTEEEYKALFAIEKTSQARRETDPLTAEQRQAMRTQYEADVLAALGPERAADLDALQKAGGDKLPRLMARLDLPLATISTLNAVRDDIGTRAKDIYTDPALSPAQRDAQLAQLASEADEKLTGTLGKRGYEAYADLKGDWIRALKPRKK